MGHAVRRGNSCAVLGQGRPDPLALFSPGVFFVTRSDEMFATDTSVVHQVRSLTRGRMSRFNQVDNSCPCCDGEKQIWSRHGSVVTKGTRVKRATY